MTMTQEQVFAELRKQGVTRVEVQFSGGNDEGGADSITLFQGDKEVGELVDVSGGGRWDPELRQWVEKVLTPEDELAKALAGPVYDRYGSFSGEFNVEGVVTWDVEKGTVKTKGQESTTTWEDFEDYISADVARVIEHELGGRDHTRPLGVQESERKRFRVVPRNEPNGEGSGWEPCGDDAPGVLFYPERTDDPNDTDAREGTRTREAAQAACDALNKV